MDRIKIGIIGCGAVAEMYHLPALMSMPEFEIRYLVDISKDRAEFVKKRLKCDGEIDTDYNRLLQETDLDAVLILTPPKLHHRIAISAAKARKHIFCEKPFAMNVKEAEEIIDCCNSNHVKLFVGFNFRFTPAFSKMKDLLDDGFFGKPISAQSTLFANSLDWPSVSKFHLRSDEGGGALFEMGVHHIDLMNWLFGKADKVFAEIHNMKNLSIDDTASVLINYQNGVNCMINIGWNNVSLNTMTIVGSDGYATAFANKPEILYFRKNLIGQDPIRIRVKRGVSSYHKELKEFYNYLTGRGNKNVSSEELINSIKLVKSSYESSRVDEFVKIT